jgi:hypothetical protein
MEEEGDGERKGMEGMCFGFSFAPLRLCVFTFYSDPRFILIRVLQTIDHAVNPVLDEPIPKIDHQPESQVP